MEDVPRIDPEKIIRRNRDGSLEYLEDDLTVEQPLEIRIRGKTLVTTMRTPGHDAELAAGFLISEGIIRERRQIAEISADGDNAVIIKLGPGVKVNWKNAQRFGTISSSCGLCGKKSLDAMRQNFGAIKGANIRIGLDVLISLTEKVRRAQRHFARTGGIHASGIFDAMGELKIVREDIGRHNAVDKVVGYAFFNSILPLDSHILLVSGRASLQHVP